jgi:hypothetical protein
MNLPIQERIARLEAKHGALPPPWVAFDGHPYSIGWRMGDGEHYMDYWWAWWKRQAMPEDRKIAYFQRWRPTHAWLAIVILAIWGVSLHRDPENASPLFVQLKLLGFGDREDYERDLKDPKWFKPKWPKKNKFTDG